MTSRTPDGPARAKPGSTPGGAPGRRAITEPAPPPDPATITLRPPSGLPRCGKAELQLIKGYAIAAVIVVLFTVVVPWIMSLVRNF